jgi:hypothetical protein
MEGQQKRPQFNEVSCRAVAEKIADDVVTWCQGKTNRDEVIADLEKAIAYGEDGYSIAKYLDTSRGWDVDADLVEILDRTFFEKLALHDKAVNEWVLAYSIKPKLEAGAAVTVHNRSTGNKVVDGQIVSIDEKRGRYTVFIEALGHVRSGCGTTGVVLPFEDVEMQTAESTEACVA